MAGGATVQLYHIQDLPQVIESLYGSAGTNCPLTRYVSFFAIFPATYGPVLNDLCGDCQLDKEVHDRFTTMINGFKNKFGKAPDFIGRSPGKQLRLPCALLLCGCEPSFYHGCKIRAILNLQVV